MAGRQECPPHPQSGFLIAFTLAFVGASLVGTRPCATDVPPASFLRMTKDAHGSSDAAVDPSSVSLPMNRRQAGRLPQDDRIGEGMTETSRQGLLRHTSF